MSWLICALSASLATSTPTAGPSSVPLEATSSDDAIDRANAEFQKQREADREAQRRARESRNATPTLAASTPASDAVTPSVDKLSATPPVIKVAEIAKAPEKAVPNGLPSRAQMEAERLARQAARAGSFATSGAGPSSSTTAAISAGPSSSTQPQRASSALARSAHPFRSSSFPADDAGEYYPDGELRHSGLTIGDPTSDPTFSPEQVIGRVGTCTGG